MLIAVNSPVAQELFKKSRNLDGLSLALNCFFTVLKWSSSYATGLTWGFKITICEVHPPQTSVCFHESWKPLSKAQSHSGRLPKALSPRRHGKLWGSFCGYLLHTVYVANITVKWLFYSVMVWFLRINWYVDYMSTVMCEEMNLWKNNYFHKFEDKSFCNYQYKISQLLRVIHQLLSH